MTNTPRRFDENPNTTTNLQKDSTEYFGISQSGASKVIKTADAFTKANVGLSEVDNTSDANKPVSVAQQAALDLKADESDVTTALDLKADKSDTYTKSEVNIELANKADIVQEDWIEPTLLNGWTQNTLGRKIAYRKNQFNQLEFKGLSNGVGSTSDTFITLISGYFSTTKKIYAQIQGGTGFAYVVIDTDGSATFAGASKTFISLDGLVIPLTEA